MLVTLLKLCFYFAAVAGVYFLVPKKWQWWVLLLGNLLFYLHYSSYLLIYLIITIITTFVTGILLEKKGNEYKNKIKQQEDKELKKQIKARLVKEKRWILALSLCLNLGIWIALKYTGFFAGALNQLFAACGANVALPVLRFVMPLGMSYYTLVAAGYCIDIYRGKYKAERNIFKYAVFLSFFLQLIQGPFSRYDELAPSLFAEHRFSWERLYNGAMRVLWGIFKKCLIADKLSVCVEYVYENYASLDGSFLFLAMILFGIELYADFSGYMDIMVGTGQIMGIILPENFKQPFFAKSIEEFWRRWHITLGAWFKNYLFYPVSMSKWAQNIGVKSRKYLGNRTGRLIPSYFALVLVWSATGLWHGAASHYLYWGLMQMAVILFSMQMAGVYEKIHQAAHVPADAVWWQVIQMLRTFLLFAFMEIMSEAATAADALAMYAKMLFGWQENIFMSIGTLFARIGIVDSLIVLLGVIGMLVVDILKEKQISIKACIMKLPLFPRYVFYIGIIYLIVLASARDSMGGGFMYANF